MWGHIHDEQGDYAGALDKYGEALRIRRRPLGRDHPAVATTLGNMQSDVVGALNSCGVCLWRVFEPFVCCLRPLIEYCPLWLSFA